jgi:hypothetical protein
MVSLTVQIDGRLAELLRQLATQYKHDAQASVLRRK